MRAKAEEEARLERVRRQAEEAAKQQEGAWLRAKAEEEDRANRAAAEQAAIRERMEKVRQAQRESEAREAALEEEMKRVRMETQVEEDRVAKLRAEAARQEQLQEEMERAAREYGEARRRGHQEQENRLRAEQQRQQLAASQDTMVSAARVSARARMAPLDAAEEQARADLQAMLDRKTFLAVPPVPLRDEVAEAQSILEKFKASAESQLQYSIQYELASHAQSTHRV